MAPEGRQHGVDHRSRHRIRRLQQGELPKMIEWLMGHLRRLEQAFEPNIPALRQLLRTKFQKSDVREATTS
jgi:hypothetical protein